MDEDMIVSCKGYRYQDGSVSEIDDVVVREGTVTLFLNGEMYVRMVASCDMLPELGAGFFTAAGIAERILSVRVEGTEVFVEAELRCDVPPDGFSPAKPVRCIAVTGGRVAPEEIFALREALNTRVWRDTGGMHCAALWYDHRCVVAASDVGRHNAVDKVIGWMVLHQLPPGECMLGSTGRQPAGMVAKAVNAGIPVIAARAAVTVMGAEVAMRTGVTLIGFVREGRFTVYTHPERVTGLCPEAGIPMPAKECGVLAAPLPGLRYCEGRTVPVEDAAVVEDVVTLFLNGREFIKTVVSCEYLREFAVGFFVGAGLVCSASDILSVRAEGTEVFVEAACTVCVPGEMESAGGFAPLRVRGRVFAGGKITPEEIFAVRDAVNAEVWDATGGLHCAVLFHDHRVVFLASDIGRHNAVDKVIGYMILAGLNPRECAIGSTGRQPAGMVTKAANAGVPIVVSRAAATDAGIAAAEECGVTLVCFTRPPRFTVYAHPERVAGFL
ncbi:formate dehydrogenase accessory sulfurtransferase FdhD [Methanocorpusculum sp. MG]|uniref:Sulfur carrier protein FdhD n=1 Tax=Methanocorpusculum petauri TaxID=3002863 RepID=A0ABT4IIK0_9EURY|nr:formate dehydrogenase accessory sulfurtransferase FdhD [Methanocorpusculum petauri]MCZ0861572.1 formate dehydrogenase accessory sulfurtransferase FdhD [Methanocorpusculum petauri]